MQLFTPPAPRTYCTERASPVPPYISGTSPPNTNIPLFWTIQHKRIKISLFFFFFPIFVFPWALLGTTPRDCKLGSRQVKLSKKEVSSSTQNNCEENNLISHFSTLFCSQSELKSAGYIQKDLRFWNSNPTERPISQTERFKYSWVMECSGVQSPKISSRKKQLLLQFTSPIFHLTTRCPFYPAQIHTKTTGWEQEIKKKINVSYITCTAKQTRLEISWNAELCQAAPWAL